MAKSALKFKDSVAAYEKLAQEIIRVYEGGQPINIVNRNSLKGMETK